MKKSLIIVASAIFCAATVLTIVSIGNERSFMNDLFNANVEALSQTETGMSGGCAKTSGECMAFCPKCGKQVYTPLYLGPVTWYQGTCGHCDE